MQVRNPFGLAGRVEAAAAAAAAAAVAIAALSAVALVGCSGGSKGPPVVSSTCNDPAAFCLTGCNLGCTKDGCSVTEVAQNQPLVFEFSQVVDPGSVDFTTFSLKTLTGEEPVGTFFTEDSRVTFIPEVRSIQGQTFFGFKANESYVLTLPGGPGAPTALVSTAGDRLAQTITCNMRVSGGVVDLDGQAPKATVIAPTRDRDVPRDTNIVLEFSEMIDFAPFFEAPVDEQPIFFRVRHTRLDQGVGRSCDDSSRAFQLSGSPRLESDAIRGVTTATFRPRERLPANACLEIEVTSRVRDLAGTRAEPQVFRFILESAQVEERRVVESFDSDVRMDQDRSGGTWTAGNAVFTRLGGDGRHGDFDIADGVMVGPSEYVWNTDSVLLSYKQSSFLPPDQFPLEVTDGRFFFTSFELPEGLTLRLIGSKPARFFVRGRVQIEGTIIANGARVPSDHDGKNSSPGAPGPGQAGSAGGPGAGAGGAGAFACDGTGNPDQPQFNNFSGFAGEDLVVPAGHAYANLVRGSGGPGSALFPSHGDAGRLQFRWLPPTGVHAGHTASGGGGGGFLVQGAAGHVTTGGSTSQDAGRNQRQDEVGPDTQGGRSIPLLTRPPGRRSVDHYLVGGSGGGGGASHPVFATAVESFKFWSGGGGAGGGGAVGFRSGRSISTAGGSTIALRGGSGASPVDHVGVFFRGAPCPGGGGSGGTLLLQVDGEVDLQGILDVRGGPGIVLDLVAPPSFFVVTTAGGDGSHGYARLEVPLANPGEDLIPPGTLLPPETEALDNVARLETAERDTFVGFQSEWRGTNEIFPPTWKRYEIVALVDGVRRVFSDDPAVGVAAIEGQAPVVFYVEGGDVDPLTEELLPGTQRFPWRRFVGPHGPPSERSLSADGRTGFRWQLLLDQRIGVDVVVLEVVIVHES